LLYFNLNGLQAARKMKFFLSYFPFIVPEHIISLIKPMLGLVLNSSKKIHKFLPSSRLAAF